MEQKLRLGFCRDVARKKLRDAKQNKSPIDVYLICELNGFQVLEESLGRHEAGKINLESNIVTVNSDHSIGRQRFSAAHEMGHYCLGHSQRRDIEDYDINEAGRSIWEREADAFAAELLMPLHLLKVSFKTRPDYKMLAREYGVSTQAMTIKLQSHNLF